MALLSDTDRQEIFVELEDALSSENVPVSFGRPDGRLAIDNIDQWIEDKMAEFNNLFPAEVKTSLSTKWKLRAFKAIITKKFQREVG